MSQTDMFAQMSESLNFVHTTLTRITQSTENAAVVQTVRPALMVLDELRQHIDAIQRTMVRAEPPTDSH